MQYQKRRFPISSIKEATSEPPKFLFHYTSPDAALGILTNEELWASSISFMNDTSEMVYTKGLVKSLITKRIEAGISSTGTPSDEIIEFLSILRELMDSGTLIGACAISFTELPDALSQWRAYCPKSGGYSIGIPVALINKIIAPPEPNNKQFPLDTASDHIKRKKQFRLVQCIYKPIQHEKIVNQVIDDCIEEYKTYIGSRAGQKITYGMTKSTPYDFAVDCLNYIQEVALYIKHEGFKEEKEWRLIYPFSMDKSNYDHPSILSFRPSDNGIMHFMKFSLKQPIEPEVQTSYNSEFHLSVIIGPCSNPIPRRQALTFFMLNNKSSRSITLSGIGNSVTPYKSW